MIVCYDNVTYVFQSESTLYSCWNAEELLALNRCNIGSLSDSKGIWTHNHLAGRQALNHLPELAKWFGCIWIFICTVHLIVCYYHVTYVFQSYSTLYSYLNIKELPPRNRCDIWSLNNSNEIWTHNDWVGKQTLNHLVKLTKWLGCAWVLICMVHWTVCYYHVTYIRVSELIYTV